MRFFISFRPQEVFFRTFDDLHLSDFQLSLWNSSSIETVFVQAHPESAMGKLYSDMLLGDKDSLLYEKEEEATALLLSRSDVAAFESAITFSHVPQIVPMWRFKDALLLHNGVVLQRDSEIKDFLDFHLIRLDQAGVRKKLLDKWGLKVKRMVPNERQQT